MRRAALYICYYDVTEPLVQTQVIAYLRELAKQDIEMHLLTFERERLSIEKQQAILSELSASGIRWHALRYHERPSLPATLYDIVAGARAAMKICRQHDIGLVHARSHVPAAMALILKRLMKRRFLFDLRGLLAEEYADAGHWSEGDLKYRLTKRMERAFFRRADAFVMLTHRIKEELTASEPELQERAADIKVIPCCVDVERFFIASKEREEHRRERGWAGRRVITYVGKLGTWYLPEEMVEFFAALRRRDARFFFQVLTQSDPAPMRQALQKAGVSPDDYDIGFAPPDRLPVILAASDAGISFIRASYSKRASSPTKMGEYLAAGLPVVTSADIGDCDRMVKDNGLGTVVADFSDAEYDRAADELCAMIEDESVKTRCREFAEKELSLSRVGGPRYASVYERLLRLPLSAGVSDIAEIT